MELTPRQITGRTFATARKGYDPDEVTSFLAEVATAYERAQQHGAEMESRARAVATRLDEVTAQHEAAVQAAAQAAATVPAGAPDEVETISRTLLLAQRTADTTVADARAEAERIVAEARAEAAELIVNARDEARREFDDERALAANEVEALRARREFLVGDVDQLEQFLIDQRDRLRGAARQIEALVDRVPSGLGSVRPPVLSADGDADVAIPADGEITGEIPIVDITSDDDTPVGSDGEFARIAAAAVPTDPWAEPTDETAELLVPTEIDGPFADAGVLVDAVDRDVVTLPERDVVEAEIVDVTAADDAPDLPQRNPRPD